MPLKGIPFIISPDLLHVLSSAGHADEIVLADAHFPTTSICKRSGVREIRADGISIPPLLEAILKLFPLDLYESCPVSLMDLVDSDKMNFPDGPSIWKEYEGIVKRAEPSLKHQTFTLVERFKFYEQAKKAFAIVATGETAQYGNIILRKGVVIPDK